MTNRELAEDQRPANCRFRLQDEGKGYPRSACHGCGATISTGLGSECRYKELKPNKLLAEELKSIKVDRSELNTAMKDAGAYLTENENRLLTALIENLPTIIKALEK